MMFNHPELFTPYGRMKEQESYDREWRKQMEITQGIVTKISTTKDQCVRLVIDIDKAYAEKVNLLKWQDQAVSLQCDEVENG